VSIAFYDQICLKRTIWEVRRRNRATYFATNRTLFKAIYRRTTNFSVEAIEQVFNGTPNFGQKVTATISRNGDLINTVVLQVQFPALAVTDIYGTTNIGTGSVAWTNWVGHALIKDVTFEIGGQQIDKHYGTWLQIWNELTQVSEKWNGLSIVRKSNTQISCGH
jgi:hypothetical protein